MSISLPAPIARTREAPEFDPGSQGAPPRVGGTRLRRAVGPTCAAAFSIGIK